MYRKPWKKWSVSLRDAWDHKDIVTVRHLVNWCLHTASQALLPKTEHKMNIWRVFMISS